MIKELLRPFLRLWFLLSRPMTLGVRGICLNTATNSVLLVKHTYSYGWTLPGGGVEAGESVLSALRRELIEEVGIQCKSAQVLDVYHNSPISKQDHVVVYLVEDWKAELGHELPRLEIADTGWFKIDDLPQGLTPCTRRGIELYEQGQSQQTLKAMGEQE